MMKWLDGRVSARILLVFSSLLCTCIWVPRWWKTISAVFAPGQFDFLASFLRIVFIFASLPLILTVLSFPAGKRFPALFCGRSVLLGGVYSVFGTACVFSLFLLGVLTSKANPVQQDAAVLIFVLSMIVLGIILLLDYHKFHPGGWECGARLLVCAAYSPSLFLCYTVVWDLLCELADKLK